LHYGRRIQLVRIERIDFACFGKSSQSLEAFKSRNCHISLVVMILLPVAYFILRKVFSLWPGLKEKSFAF